MKTPLYTFTVKSVTFLWFYRHVKSEDEVFWDHACCQKQEELFIVHEM